MNDNDSFLIYIRRFELNVFHKGVFLGNFFMIKLRHDYFCKVSIPHQSTMFKFFHGQSQQNCVLLMIFVCVIYKRQYGHSDTKMIHHKLQFLFSSTEWFSSDP